MVVTGAVAGYNGAANDSIIVSVGLTSYFASGNNYFPDLGKNWQEAEFNVFGDNGGDQAVFNSGANIVVRITLNSTTWPVCHLTTWTGESNNLTLVNSPPVAGKGLLPALVFSESTIPAPLGGAATCYDVVLQGPPQPQGQPGCHWPRRCRPKPRPNYPGETGRQP
jgi:hypothetical protein